MSQALYEAALSLFGQGRHGEAVQALGQAAQGGHPPAMALLGAQLLSGRGIQPDPVAGMRLTMAAAAAGSAFAQTQAAALVASGVGGSPDWPRALTFLRRAADQGFEPAREQMTLVKALGGNPQGWRTAPKPQVLHEAPFIRAFPGLLPPAVCGWLIGRARERLEPAQVYDAVTLGPTLDSARRNSAAGFSLADTDIVLMAARERLCAAAGRPTAHAGGPQVLHYAMGQEFTPHYDFIDPELEGPARDLAIRGQRVTTGLVYLNDGLEGGETDFPLLALRHRGALGDALVFDNVDASGAPDRQTLHAGLPPTKGEKWILSLWIRDRAPPGSGDPRFAEALAAR